MDDQSIFHNQPASSASSSRTVRASNRSIHSVAGSTFYINPNQTGSGDSLNTLSTITQNTSGFGGPVPPARSSSLALRGGHGRTQIQSSAFAAGPSTAPSDQYLVGGDGDDGEIPSFQVTQPTPTKGRKFRTRSASLLTNSSIPLAEGSQSVDSGSPTTSGLGTLGVTVESRSSSATNLTRGQSRSRTQLDEEEEMDEDDEDEDDEDVSEAERQREVEEARKLRAREKGRERQRRKRERDKRAKEEARMTGTAPQAASTALMTATHLPIPARNSSVPQLQRNASSQSIPLQAANQPPLQIQAQNLPQQVFPFSMSVPSSASSSYSQLPQTQSGYYNLSPNASTSFTSISLSGQSSPNALFSPAISTPATGLGTDDGNLAMWSARTDSTSSLILEAGPVETSHSNSNLRAKRSVKGKARAASQGLTIDPSQIMSHAMFQSVSGRGKKKSEGSSRLAKRRKSEPRLEEFREEGFGLGVSMNGESWQQPISTGDTPERPKPRRTASEGAAVPLAVALRDQTSPTPPPLVSATTGTSGEKVQGQSEAGAFFATTLICGVTAAGFGTALQNTLGMGERELDGLRSELAAVYDRWSMERGLRNVSIGDAAAMFMGNLPMADTSATGQSAPQMSSAAMVSNTSAISPQQTTNPGFDASFFTPAPARTARSHTGPQSMPAYTAFSQAVSMPPQGHESPLARQKSQRGRKGDTYQNTSSHSRSLSSNSMLARGLILHPAAPGATGTGAAHPIQGDGRWPGTPGDLSGAPSGSDGNTTSPSVQTPSTGQGGFPSLDSMGMMSAMTAMNAAGTDPNQWRSATDPQPPRMYTTQNPPVMMRTGTKTGDGLDVDMSRDAGTSTGGSSTTSGEWSKAPSPLDSPLAMSKQAQANMPPPPATLPRNYTAPFPQHQQMQQHHSGQPQTMHGQPAPYSVPPVRGNTGQYTTPVSSKQYRTQHVPFTPETPISARSTQASGGSNYGMAMYYDPTFSAGAHPAQPQAHDVSMGDQTQSTGFGYGLNQSQGFHEGGGRT